MSEVESSKTPQLVEDIAKSGDTAARFSRLRANVGLRLSGAGVVGTVGYQAAMGHEVFSYSLPFYGAVATAGVLSVNKLHRRREDRLVREADAKQEKLRQAFDEPVDLFVKGSGRKKRTIVRWYGADADWVGFDYYGRIKAGLPDRLLAVAKAAEENSIDQVAVSHSLMEMVPEAQRPSLEEAKSSQELMGNKKREIYVAGTSNYIHFLSPAEATELAAILEKPTSRERVAKVTRLEALVGKLKAHSVNEVPQLVMMFEALGTHVPTTSQLQEFTATLKSTIEQRYEDTEGVANKILINGGKRNTKVHTTPQLRGKMMTLFSQSDDVYGETTGGYKVDPLVEMAGYKDLTALWADLMADESKIPAEEFAFLAEVAAWELIRQEKHNAIYTHREVEKEVMAQDGLTGYGTYLQRLSKGHRVLKSIELRVEERKKHVKRMLTPLAALTVAASIILPSFGPDMADELQHSTSQSNAAGRHTGETLQKLRGADREISDDVATGVKAVPKAIGGLWPDNYESKDPYFGPTGPIDGGPTRSAHHESTIGDSPGAENADGRPDWSLNAPKGVDVSGYWAASVQKKITRSSDAKVPPYATYGMLFMEDDSLPNSLSLREVPLRDPQNLSHQVPYIKVSGDRRFSDLDMVPDIQGSAAGYALNLSVKEGTVPEAVKVEVVTPSSIDDEKVAVIPAKIVRTPEQTYKLLLSHETMSKSQKQDGTGYLRLSYWLNTKPQTSSHTRAVTMMSNDHSEPLANLLTPAHTAQVAKALGLDPSRTYTPQEIAQQIRQTKRYSLTPYSSAGIDNRSSWLSRDLRGEDVPEAEAYTKMAVTAGQLPEEICNTATMIGVIGSEGGTPTNFVNVVSGHNNNGDGTLKPDELHNYMVTNRGEEVDATPSGGAQQNQSTSVTPPTPEKKVSTVSAAFNDLKEKSKYPGLALGGLVVAGLAVSGLRRGARRAKEAAQTTSQVYSEKWLEPARPKKIAQRHDTVDLLQNLMHGVRLNPPRPHSFTHNQSVANRYRNLPKDPSYVAELITQRRQEGWPITAAMERQVMNLANHLAKQ